jgi:hypothetical protein
MRTLGKGASQATLIATAEAPNTVPIRKAAGRFMAKT